MNSTMEWSKLLSQKRLGQEDRERDKEEPRTEFQRDFDRIVFSSAFRRLQSKTQVVPLPTTDFVHTRLTHSIETSCVGRSLGKIIGEEIITKLEKKEFLKTKITSDDFGAIIAAACLSHDIGNPPFGHSGESAISDYFKSAKGKKFLISLTKKQKEDLQNYEGNAAGFRLLTHTSPSQSYLVGGLFLTYATLGTFTKYPKESLPNSKESENASEKKYGIFQSELDAFKKIAKELGLMSVGKNGDYQWKRHPLAFLMEAADDISYNVVDLEDAFKLKLVSFKEIEKMLLKTSLNSSDKSRYKQINDDRERVAFLRAKCINKFILDASQTFIAKYSEIMNGSFDIPLTKVMKSAEKFKVIKNFSKNVIYPSRYNVEIEAAGFEVVGGLLDACLSSIFGNTSKDEKIKQLIPKQYKLDKNLPDYKYLQLLNIANFIAGMTDTFAISFYRTIKGISLPNNR